VLVEGRLQPIVSLAAAFVLLFTALGLALGMRDAGMRWTAFLALALSWFYTAPPLRLNYRGLGELTVATVLNLLVPLLAYGLQAHHLSAPAVLVSAVLPIFVVQVARMMVMNLSDYEGDERIGKRTLAVILGPRRAILAVALGQVLAYVSIVVLTLAHVLPAMAGVAMLLTAPIATWQIRRLQRGALRDPRRANSVVFWASTHVAILAAAALFGLLAASIASGSRGVGMVVCAAILAVFIALLVPQILRNGRPERRDHATVG
jgi:1,4-dihydroxy-2-naphthoate octaprenyltransferase